MRELRCIVFNEKELIVAVLDRRRRVREPVPAGTVQRVLFNHLPTGVETTLVIVDDQGAEQSLKLAEAEVTAALVQHCMNRKIPMPADSEKYLHVIRDAITLMITMNFNRQARLVANAARRPAEETDDAPALKSRRMPRKPA